ncbi:hypothetical protein BKA93DRAFT_574298 [Sparassis latifolia]
MVQQLGPDGKSAPYLRQHTLPLLTVARRPWRAASVPDYMRSTRIHIRPTFPISVTRLRTASKFNHRIDHAPMARRVGSSVPHIFCTKDTLERHWALLLMIWRLLAAKGALRRPERSRQSQRVPSAGRPMLQVQVELSPYRPPIALQNTSSFRRRCS